MRHFRVLVIGAHVFILGWAAGQNSPTIDEVGHLPAGLMHLQYGRFDLYRVNPPLVRTVATLPVLAMHPKTDWTAFNIHPNARPEFPIGEMLVSANGKRSLRFFTVARWAVIPFSLIGGWFCYRWAKGLYGERAGLVALALWCFSPNILAHAQLITPDAAAAAVGVTAGYLFWRWLKTPDWPNALAAGIVLGFVELTKMTWVILYGLCPVLWLIWHWSERNAQVNREAPTSRSRRAAQLGVILLLSLYILNAGYGFEGSFQKLGDFQFVSRTLRGDDIHSETGNRFAVTWCGRVPVPVPKNYLTGIDVQKLDFERGKRSYLRGEWKHGGWWYYYLYAMLIKVPLGTWLLGILAVWVTVRGQKSEVRSQGSEIKDERKSAFSAQHSPLGSPRSPHWRDAVVVLAPAICVLVLVSSQTGFNHHMRYVLPAFPFLFVWISRVGRVLSWRHHKVLTCFAAGALTWSVGSSLWVYPHSLSYFNELVGGPRNGHAHLVDSNIDWGQDLLYLQDWYDGHPEARPLGLAYFGFVDPQVAGIEFALPPQDGPHPGWYAVSVNFLRGIHFSAPNGRSGKESLDRAEYTYFLHFEPVAMAGYSIYIYHVTEDEANRVRREMGLPALRNGKTRP